MIFFVWLCIKFGVIFIFIFSCVSSDSPSTKPSTKKPPNLPSPSALSSNQAQCHCCTYSYYKHGSWNFHSVCSLPADTSSPSFRTYNLWSVLMDWSVLAGKTPSSHTGSFHSATPNCSAWGRKECSIWRPLLGRFHHYTGQLAAGMFRPSNTRSIPVPWLG